MAVRPCSLCKKRYTVAAQHVYPAIASLGTTLRGHLRLCPSCFDELINSWTNMGLRVDDDDYSSGRELRCVFCWDQIDRNDPHQFFATTYARGEDRVDWYGQVHPECSPGLGSRLELPETA